MGRRKTPQFYYNQQKQSAKHRGIAWEMDFDEWWKIWRDSGKWGERGCRIGQFGMNRFNDTGPYKVGNVFIGEAGKNASDGMKNWPEKKRLREANEVKMCDCCLAVVNETLEKPREEIKFQKLEQVIPLEEFKSQEKVVKEIWGENKFSPKQQGHWTFSKIVCLMFPVWGPRWFAPNK